MKDALGHGSNPRGSGFNAALDTAAHQVRVNSAAPNVAGHELYEQMSADHAGSAQTSYSTKELKDMLPDFDEFGDQKLN